MVADIPVVVLVFAASWLAAPLIYTLDKLAAMEDQRWVFAAGVVTLPLFGLICTILAKDSPGKKETLFYGKYFVGCTFDLIKVVCTVSILHQKLSTTTGNTA